MRLPEVLQQRGSDAALATVSCSPLALSCGLKDSELVCTAGSDGAFLACCKLLQLTEGDKREMREAEKGEESPPEDVTEVGDGSSRKFIDGADTARIRPKRKQK